MPKHPRTLLELRPPVTGSPPKTLKLGRIFPNSQLFWKKPAVAIVSPMILAQGFFTVQKYGILRRNARWGRICDLFAMRQ